LGGNRIDIDKAVFVICDKAYLGTGRDDVNPGLAANKKDFWEYDPSLNAWTQKANFGGTARLAAVGLSIGNYGYIGTGDHYDGQNHWKNDFWKYTPDTGSCKLPSNLRARKITSTSVQLRWDSAAGAQKYKLRYKEANTNDWTILNPVGHKKDITGLMPNTTYVWQVRTYCQVDSPSILSPWSSKQEFTTLPYRLSEEPQPQPSFQLYPNPAEDHTTIQYNIVQPSHVSIIVYDASGKEMKTALNDDVEQGTHTLPLNIKDFTAGIYFVKMISDFRSETQKMMVQ
jgi:hypothetical protein